MIEDRGLLSLHPLTANGVGGHFCRSLDWPENFEIAEPFDVNGRTFFLFCRQRDGLTHIHEAGPDGRLGTRLHRRDSGANWAAATFYQAGGTTFSVRVKDDGLLRVRAMTSHGNFGAQTAELNSSSGWTHLRAFRAGARNFLFMLKKSNGTAQVRRMEANGAIGPVVDGPHNWSSGWTVARIFTTIDGPFLFLLKSATGLVHIHRMNDDGSVGARIQDLQWSHLERTPHGFPVGADWTDVEFYQAGGQNRVFLLKEGDGRAHVHRVGDDGRIAADPVYNEDYTSGWTQARAYAVGGTPFLLLQKERGARPLRRTYVEHVAGPIRLGQYITDSEGHVRDSRGDRGIDFPVGDTIDIRVVCHNAIVRVPNLLFDRWRDFTGVVDDKTVTIRYGSQDYNEFRIANRCIELYDNIYRPFPPFDNADFPFKSSGSLDDKRGSDKRIDVIYPDRGPQWLSYTQPAGPHGYPELHYKTQAEDGRLFGDGANDPELIPAEVAHALYFTRLSAQQRVAISAEYVAFLIGEPLAGRAPTHEIDKSTNPMVAFQEAMDHFGHRFAMFIRHRPTSDVDSNFRRQYLIHELSVVREVGEIADPNALATSPITPKFTGGTVEGAVFGGLYLDWARRSGVGLTRAVGAIYRSQALTLGEFIDWVANNEPSMIDSLRDVAVVWGL